VNAARNRPSLDQVAFSEAIADLTTFLDRLGLADAGRHAHDFMRHLVEAGWRHTRPKLDLEPPKGVPASPESRAQHIAEAREVLAQGDDHAGPGAESC
jgi:hypothetical protein